jgi:putative oxidoreductase
MADLKAAARAAAPIVLRLALGAILVFHGAQKFGLLDPARGWDTTQAAVRGFAGHLEQLNVPLPLASAWAATLTEFLGGAFILLGFATPFACAGVVAIMAVAIATVHWQFGFAGVPVVETRSVHPGYEYDVMLIAGAAALGLLGAGPLSLDALFARIRSRKKKS